MGNLTNYARNELLDHLLNAAYVPAATVYLALATADPTDAATGEAMNEVPDANGYTRKAISFGAAANRRITQDAVVTYDQASGAWGTATHWAIVDSATHGAGNALAHGALGVAKPVVNGNTPSVASGEVYVEILGEIGSDTANGLLGLMFDNQAYAKPDTYLALVTSVSDESGIGTEVNGVDYARVQVNINGGSSPTWDVASGGASANTHDIDFVVAGGAWGTVVGVALMSAAADGTLLMYDNTMADQAVAEDDTVSFPAGDLDITLT